MQASKLWIAVIMPVALAGTATLGAAAAGPHIVSARGQWAALRGPRACEAATLSLLPPTARRARGRIGIAFEPRRRNGELAARLSRPARDGAGVVMTIGETPFLLVGRGDYAWSRGPSQEAAIIAAIRGASRARIEARTVEGARFVDPYSLDGAPTAIDAAAACAATLVNR